MHGAGLRAATLHLSGVGRASCRSGLSILVCKMIGKTRVRKAGVKTIERKDAKRLKSYSELILQKAQSSERSVDVTKKSSPYGGLNSRGADAPINELMKLGEIGSKTLLSGHYLSLDPLDGLEPIILSDVRPASTSSTRSQLSCASTSTTLDPYRDAANKVGPRRQSYAMR